MAQVEADAGAAGAEEKRPRAIPIAGASSPSRILIACMPKSGSTFLSDLVSALPDFKRATFSASPARGRQHELDESSLRAAGHGNYVGQVHVFNSEWTAKMCRDYRLKPVVLVRSLPDAVVSLRDHIRREGGRARILHIDPNSAAFDDATLEKMIIRFQAPWYVNFYMSWRAEPEALMISYEQLTADPERMLRRIVDFAGAAASDQDIAKAVGAVRERRESRFNVGVAGRGAKLRPELLRDLGDLFDFYPEAASDPYVKGVRTQIEAALAGAAVPTLGEVALGPARPAPSPASARRGKSAKLRRSVTRWGYQVTLIAAGLLYWVWPEDLIPDDRWYGQIDDAIFLAVLAFLAGRVTKRTPGVRDLPGVVSRAFARRLKAAG